MQPYEIKGQSVAKRAFEVASVGELGVLLIGPLGSSKSTIRGAFPNVRSAERETCVCGHHHDVRQECTCKPESLKRWLRRLERTARDYEIVLEGCPVTARDMISQRAPDPQKDGWMHTRIAEARTFGETHTSVELKDDSAIRMVEMAMRRLQLTYGQYNAMLKVARAIANLDGSELLKAKHVAEAIQYSAVCVLNSLGRE